MQAPCRARPSPSAMRAPRRAARTARSRAARSPRKARPGRRRMPSSTACARRSISCCRTRMPPSSPGSRRRWSRSWRRSARSRRVLARRVAVAAWRLARADRIEAELFEERRVASGGLGLALIRDGNGARSFETLLRYRGAAMAEFWRALRTLKALQAEQALEDRRRPGGAPAPARGAADGSPIARNRTNPSASWPDRNTSRASRPRPAPCTSPPPPGGRTNPSAAPHPRLEAASAGSPVTAGGGSPVGRCACRPPAIASDHAGDNRPGAAFTV